MAVETQGYFVTPKDAIRSWPWEPQELRQAFSSVCEVEKRKMNLNQRLLPSKK